MTQTPLNNKDTTHLKIVQVLGFQLLPLGVRHGLVPVVGPGNMKLMVSWLLLLLLLLRLRWLMNPLMRLLDPRTTGPSCFRGLEGCKIFLLDVMHPQQVLL